MGREEVVEALFASLNSPQLLKQLLQQLQKNNNLQLPELIQLFQEAKQEQLIPLSIFSSTLYPAEALCKYLHEQEHLSYHEIAVVLKRNERSVWASCQRARKKLRSAFIVNDENYLLPLSLFQNPFLTLLESVVLYLHTTYNLTNPQIAKLLHKSPNSMAVLLKRAREKNAPVKHPITKNKAHDN